MAKWIESCVVCHEQVDFVIDDNAILGIEEAVCGECVRIGFNLRCETVAVVWMGANNERSYLGVFKTVAGAELFLLNVGVKKGIYPDYVHEGITIPAVVIFEVTPEFQEWVDENCTEVPWVNGAHEGWRIHISKVPLNTIVRGYDND